MNTKEIDSKYIINTYSRCDLVLCHGKSATCTDESGREYIDFGAGIGVNSLGYCDSSWAAAISDQAARLQHCSNLYYSSPAARLAKLLCQSTGYQKTLFCNSGAEANECAIKLARKYSFDKYGDIGRNIIITLKNSFHGRTITTLAATGQDVFHNYFFPFTEGFRYAQANDIEDLKAKIDDKICAVMVEFIQGEGGVIPLEQKFVSELFKLCGQQDILIIADEVQTGIGRTGKLLASEHFGVKPNITSLAKGLGGGLPIGAVLADEKTCDTFKPGDHGTTFGANPVVCAGAEQVLLKLTENGFLESVAEKGNYIRKALSALDEVESIDGIGLMLGIALKGKSSAKALDDCISRGVIPLTAKDKLRLLPPLTITEKELHLGLERLIAGIKQ